MGKYLIGLEIRNLKLEYDTAGKRDGDFKAIVAFLKARGVTTANASVHKKDIAISAEAQEVFVAVLEGEGIPQPQKE